MRFLLVGVLFCLIFTLSAFAGSLKFTATLPSATQSTLGANQRLDIEGAAFTEIRTKLQNWATYTGYSAGTAR